MLRVAGRMQRLQSATHVIAEEIEDISGMLDLLVRGEGGRSAMRNGVAVRFHSRPVHDSLW